MSNTRKHKRSKQNLHVAFFKEKPRLERQERVTHDLDKHFVENGTPYSTRILSLDLFCTFARIQPGKAQEGTIQKKLREGKL